MESHEAFSFIMNRKKKDILEKIAEMICGDDDYVDEKKRKKAVKTLAELTNDSNVERKYHDKSFSIGCSWYVVGCNRMWNSETPNDTKPLFNGRTFFSNTQVSVYGMDAVHNGSKSTENNLLRGLVQGTSATTRIGASIVPKYIKGSMTFNAAVLRSADGAEGHSGFMAQSGESLVHTSLNWWDGGLYMRTTFRMVIVKDLQINNSSGTCHWNNVFEWNTESGGIHSEQKVSSMGRYIILRDETFHVKAKDPVAERSFFIHEDEIGPVRYVVSTTPNVSDVSSIGIYVIWAAFVSGADAAPEYSVKIPHPFGHSRLCFTDQ
nr:MAG: capsid protein [Cressdnaviricota sp.]